MSFLSYTFLYREYFKSIIIGYKDKILTKNDIETKNISLIGAKNSSNFQTNKSFDKVIEWEKLNNIYFKRSAAYYFVEDSLLTALYLADTKHTYDIVLTAYFTNKKIYKLKFYQIDIQIFNHNNFFWFEIKIRDDYFKKNEQYIQNLLISITDKSNFTTLNPIDVKIKYKLNDQKGNLICTKCYELNQNQILDLMWWIELNKQSGYDKIILCNNSIPNDKNLELFLDERKNFIELVQMSYFPYFNNKTNRYFKRFNEIGKYINNLKLNTSFTRERNVYEIIQYNECFYENKNKYKQITIVDLDEVIMPFHRNISNQVKYFESFVDQCDDINCLNQRTDICKSPEIENIDAYVKSIDTRQGGFNFSPAYYLSHKTMETILGKLNIFIQNYTQNELIDKPILIIVNDPNCILNFTFRFKSKDDIAYIKMIDKIFTILINDKNININSTGLTSIFLNRFIYFASRNTFYTVFKSIHYTNNTLRVRNHNEIHKVGEPFVKVPYSEGHMSHFRISYSNALTKSQSFTATDLGFDINYLICYYPSILQTIKKSIKQM